MNGTLPLWQRAFSHPADVSEVLVAIFTGLLVYVTYRLVISTNKLWNAGERQLSQLKQSSEHQLRAYVYIADGEIRFINDARGPGFIVHIVLRNYGQTPAREFSTWLGGNVYDFEDFPFPEPKPLSQRVNRSIVGPTATVDVQSDSAGIDDILAVCEKRRAIFVWGGADYVDAFGNPRSFVFRMRICGQLRPVAGGLGWPLTPHPIGYSDN